MINWSQESVEKVAQKLRDIDAYSQHEQAEAALAVVAELPEVKAQATRLAEALGVIDGLRGMLFRAENLHTLKAYGNEGYGLALREHITTAERFMKGEK